MHAHANNGLIHGAATFGHPYSLPACLSPLIIHRMKILRVTPLAIYLTTQSMLLVGRYVACSSLRLLWMDSRHEVTAAAADAASPAVTDAVVVPPVSTFMPLRSLYIFGPVNFLTALFSIVMNGLESCRCCCHRHRHRLPLLWFDASHFASTFLKYLAPLFIFRKVKYFHRKLLFTQNGSM